jgi:hypothetical protein
VVADVTIHVSPSGNDDGDGSEKKPFATLHRAQQEAREHAGREAVTVLLHRGTHYLQRPLRFEAADSGTKDKPVSYVSIDNSAIVSGGQQLSLKWSPLRDGVFQATTPGGLAIDQLFIDGTRQHMARYPNFDPNVRHFNGFAADAFSKERAADWKDPAGGYIHAMHRAHWGGYHYRITGKNDKGEVTYEGGWQNNRQMGMHGQHRFVENVFEELDTAGEWYHDAKQNKLFYMPAAGVDLNSALVEIVRLRHLVEFVGIEKQPVRFINLNSLVFRHAARTFMDNREPLLRSDWTTYRGGAVVFSGAESCRIDRCEFDQVGGNAIFANKYNRDIQVTGCHIHDAGGNGICFVGNPESVRSPLFHYNERNSYGDIDKTPGPKSNDYPSNCLVDNCLIVRTGRVEKQTAGVQISMASHITVRHCSIYEVPRAGINISEGTFGGHLIEYCDVFDTVLETGDHGSFNSWGRDRFWGLKDAPEDELPELAKLDMVERNTIRNSRWRCDHGWDIDLDDGSSNYDVYNNLMLKGGLKFREGFNRVAKNNIMVGNSFHPHVWYPNSRDVFENNIVFTQYKPIRVPVPWGQSIDKNLRHAVGGEVSPAKQLAQQSGRDKNSIVADADFVGPETGNFEVKDGSPALALGFENFPMDKFGVQLPELKKLARTPSFGSVAPVTPQPPRNAKPIIHFWAGAAVRDLKDNEFSSLGVSKEEAGVLLTHVNDNTVAARAGFQVNDLLQKVNGRSVHSVRDLISVQNEAAGKPLAIGLVRKQMEEQLEVSQYTFYTRAVSASAGKLDLPSNRLAVKEIVARPGTNNEKIATLSDGKILANYGPVFGNGTSAGSYRIDLGSSKEIKSVTTVSFNQGGNRGPQRFVLLGANSDSDPEWNTARSSAFVVIAEVDTLGEPMSEFQATKIIPSGKTLGTYRWLMWTVYPVSGFAENTAFQELIVE